MSSGLVEEPPVAAAAARAAAQWLLGAFAAVLVTILGGFQLGAIYDPLTGTAPGVAIICMVAAVAATLGTIVMAGSLLVDSGISVDALIEREAKARKAFRLRPRRRTDLTHSATEMDRLLSLVVESRSATRLGSSSPTALRDLLREARLQGNSAMADDAAHDLRIFVGTANWIYFSRRFARLKWFAVVASIVVTASAAVWSYSASSAQPSSVLVTGPMPAELVLNAGADRASLDLGRACNESVLDVVIIGGTLSAPTVVTRPSEVCLAVVIERADRYGVVIPS